MAADARDLTHAEQSFVAQVEFQLRNEPEAHRRRAAYAARQAMLANAPVDTYSRIERDHGTPAEFAARLRTDDLGASASAGPQRDPRGGYAAALWVALIAVVVVVAAFIAIRLL